MTPAEHYKESERALSSLTDSMDAGELYDQLAISVYAAAHALLAIGAELGIPTGSTTAGKQATQ